MRPTTRRMEEGEIKGGAQAIHFTHNNLAYWPPYPRTLSHPSTYSHSHSLSHTPLSPSFTCCHTHTQSHTSSLIGWLAASSTHSLTHSFIWPFVHLHSDSRQLNSHIRTKRNCSLNVYNMNSWSLFYGRVCVCVCVCLCVFICVCVCVCVSVCVCVCVCK